MQLLSMEQALDAVRRQRAKWRFPMQPGCPDDEIARLRQNSQAEFGTGPPARYLDLLRITNGFWENGLHVYASRISDLLPPSNASLNGFIEATRMYRMDFHGFESLLVFAEDDAYVYALDAASGRYVKQAYVENVPSKVFETFDELMIHAVTGCLLTE